jgi:hypothetical protein
MSALNRRRNKETRESIFEWFPLIEHLPSTWNAAQELSTQTAAGTGRCLSYTRQFGRSYPSPLQPVLWGFRVRRPHVM